jgi:hypothetical protein
LEPDCLPPQAFHCDTASRGERIEVRGIIAMPISKRLFIAILILFLHFVPSLSVAKERLVSFNFWPFFHYLSDTKEGASEIEGLGPFFYWRKEVTQTEWGLRPLFYWTGAETDSLWRLEFLYPFGKYEVKEGDKKGYLFPLSTYRKQEFDKKKKWDFQFFPFFMGETEKGEDYFGLFPIFGTLLDRYGEDEIHFFLWPLYGKSTREGDWTTDVLWPFFSFTGGEKKKGFRFWPFYGQKEEFGVSSSEFVLWPIFYNKTRNLDTDDPIKEWAIFPLYISKESNYFESDTYLWPLFTHATEQRSGFEQWDIFWPLFRTFKGENLYGTRIFILYSYKVREGESKRAYLFYPLFRYWEDRIGDRQQRAYFIFFSRIETTEDEQGIEEERSLGIFPFFDYEREKGGHEVFSTLYLLPFKDEGLERNLFPLFRFYRWEKEPQGNMSSNLFWGFYRRIKKEGLDYWEVAHLIGVKKEPERKTLSLFKGLFRYKKEGETSEIRLLYIPFRIRRGSS